MLFMQEGGVSVGHYAACVLRAAALVTEALPRALVCQALPRGAGSLVPGHLCGGAASAPDSIAPTQLTASHPVHSQLSPARAESSPAAMGTVAVPQHSEGLELLPTGAGPEIPAAQRSLPSPGPSMDADTLKSLQQHIASPTTPILTLDTVQRPRPSISPEQKKSSSSLQAAESAPDASTCGDALDASRPGRCRA